MRRIFEKFINILGDIKVFPHPFFLVYDPTSYKVHGRDIRFFQERLQPGDILLRKYDNYLDGRFIPGYFSHAALYLGSVQEEDASHIPAKYQHKLRTGPQMVIHSMAEGVFMEELLDFCRCDYMLVLRLPVLKMRFAQVPPPSAMSEAERLLDSRLRSVETLSWQEVWPIIRQKALGRLGTRYDFQFNFKNYNDMSCTEFVYYTIKSLVSVHGVRPATKSLGFLRRIVLIPDAFAKAPLEVVACSRSVIKPQKENRPNWLKQQKGLQSFSI